MSGAPAGEDGGEGGGKGAGGAPALPYRPGVGVMLVNPAGLIFAGRRIDTAAPAWQMPQGGIDAGEEPEAAALRELREETGVGGDLARILAASAGWLSYDLPPELMGRAWGGRFRGQRQKWFLMRFLGRDEQITIATEPAEFSSWRWIGAEEMLAAIVPFKRALYESVLAEFAPLLR